MAYRGGGFCPAKNKKILFYSVTQNQLLANPLLHDVLSSTGIFSVDTFCFWVIHKVLSKGFQLFSS